MAYIFGSESYYQHLKRFAEIQKQSWFLLLRQMIILDLSFLRRSFSLLNEIILIKLQFNVMSSQIPSKNRQHAQAGKSTNQRSVML